MNGRHEETLLASHHQLQAANSRVKNGGVDSTPMTIGLSYCTAAPYAVELHFLAAGISWTVARDLLIAGAHDDSGDGDVHVSTHAVSGGDVTILTLSPRTATTAQFAEFSISTHELISFLAATEELVPLGSESELVQADLDALIHDSLAGTDS
ncbi:SsgA family sporulation/cell division regulator [Pseudonocardia sp. WMMC193]|uniref:SsgA family sporulation/cell division regulator n=1 Tax=Pseudonocardia sp. WMMC193 TaxID=2911965 RepID=UPI001F3A10DD|nr:SsgA family sporulation/cell division regulator [Pseudonocardia sp. WMMC193]MCF7547208.1 SsgA family sporulation/cell division regulator [Pseudonocardia sp. WMMC193]